MRTISLLLLCSAILFSCSQQQDSKSEKVLIVTTTGMIQDAVQHIVGENIEVLGLMGPGVDPHLYKATRGDLDKLNRAEVIIFNGLHLEGKMGEILEKMGRTKKVFAIGEGVEESKLIYHGSQQDSKDPHIWFDVALWASAVNYASVKLIEIFPEKEAIFKQNTSAYLSELHLLDSLARKELSSIPMEQRVLITAHDAFSYFGRAYDVEVKGLQGISTVAEFGLKDVKELVDFIVEKKIKAVFVESSIPTKSLEAVVQGCKEKGHEIKIGGTLYSDAMGSKDSNAGTYIGMVEANVATIVSSLK
ncbi:MAG: zinc ABC transporter substrate-binding protein [Bacteroidia bacterium]|nr:zinc ABC transporter substrate-binding protein [Bacteroidia bacterium]